MGIKGLSAFLRKKFPGVFEPIHISEFAFEKIAVDISLYVHIFKHTFNYPTSNAEEQDTTPKWLAGVLRMTALLRKNEVHPVFIYDTGAPKEKEVEQKRRRDVKEKTVERTYTLEDAIEEYHTTGEISDLLRDFQRKRKIPAPMLNPRDINIKQIEQAVNKMKKSLYEVAQTDFELSRELFRILEIPFIFSGSEGETMCSDLCLQGKVKAVLSQDTDTLAYGTPIFLTKLDLKTGGCLMVRMEELLDQMEFTQKQFTDFAIMCGTDYNKNIPKVGPAKAYSLLKQFGSIEEIEKNGFDVSILNYKRSRELFQNYEKTEEKAPYVGKPDFQALEKFIFKNNLTRMVGRLDFLREAFLREVVVEDGEEENESENESENEGEEESEGKQPENQDEEDGEENQTENQDKTESDTEEEIEM